MVGEFVAILLIASLVIGASILFGYSLGKNAVVKKEKENM